MILKPFIAARLVSFALAALPLLYALTFAQVASLVRVQRVIAQVESLGKRDPNDLQASLRKARESADALKKSNLFVKQTPKEHPVKQVDGILGNEVFIANAWYKVGGKIATRKSYPPTEVTIMWDGQKKTCPIAVQSRLAAVQPSPDKPEPAKRLAASPRPARRSRLRPPRGGRPKGQGHPVAEGERDDHGSVEYRLRGGETEGQGGVEQDARAGEGKGSRYDGARPLVGGRCRV
jgi:hypothetical protein